MQERLVEDRSPRFARDALRIRCEAARNESDWEAAQTNIGEMRSIMRYIESLEQRVKVLENDIAAAMRRARDEIGATEQQRIAFAYAEAAMRSTIRAALKEQP
jgi:hypothetical protein